VPHQISPEAREKLSRLAKERHASGKFGDPRVTGAMGGRPQGGSKKKQRITKRVAEAAEEEKNANAIINVFKDAIHPNQPISVRLKAAETWARLAGEQYKQEAAEVAQTADVKTREELIEILRGKLSAGPVASILQKQIESETGIVDAEVVHEEVERGDQAA
jgi:hypothetical protein